MVMVALLAVVIGGLTGAALAYQLARDPLGLGSRLPGIGPAGSDEVEGVAARVLPTVTQLRVRSGDQDATGSGVLLNPTGLILTNNHVVAPAAGGAGQITVLFQDGSSTAATIIGRDPSSDTALVQAHNAAGLTPITLGDSDSARVGQRVAAVGSPLGLGGTVTVGIISALHRAVGGEGGPLNDSGVADILDTIQTDATINPGNSGGPLVDMAGRLIGINTAIASLGDPNAEQSGSVRLGFAIPINEITRIIAELRHNGQATKPVLGAKVAVSSRLAPLTDPSGARIVQIVPPDGPAGKAGLKAGDLVVGLNDRIITTGAELIAAIRSHSPGDTVTVRLGDGRGIVVALGSQPVPATK
jgi:putative serine protease PepD